MSNPRLFLGQRGGAKVFRTNDGPTDDGRPIIFRATPNEYAPAGIAGECVFHTLYLAVTHSMAVALRVIPILDGSRLDAEAATLFLLAPPVPEQRVSTAFEVALGQAVLGLDDTTVIGRAALRGTWLTFLFDTPNGLSDGDLILESAEVEYEVVRESKPSAP